MTLPRGHGVKAAHTITIVSFLSWRR